MFLRISKGRSTYNSSFKNGIKSKKLNNYQGHSIKPENYSLLKNLGNKNELIELASKMPLISEYERKKQTPKKLNEQIAYRDYNLVFNLSNEVWMAYSLSAICDTGRELKDYTSFLLKESVLYIETNNKRYEISRNVSDLTNDDYLFEEFESFKLSEVLSPFQKDNDFMENNEIPLKNEFLDVIFPRLDWHEFEWGENTLKIKTMEIHNIKAFNFYSIKN